MDEVDEVEKSVEELSLDLRNWALNSIRSPAEVAEIIPDITLLPESFFSHCSFLSADVESISKYGEDTDTLQGLADWLSGTDLSYLKLKEPDATYVPELSEPYIPFKLPLLAQKVTNSCFQRFPFLNVEHGGTRPVAGALDPADLFAEALKDDSEYDNCEGVEGAVIKLLQKEFLPESSASTTAANELEIRRPSRGGARAPKPRARKLPQTPKEMRFRQLTRFLETVIEYAEGMLPSQDVNEELDLVFFDGDTKVLSLFTIVKIEKLAVKVMEDKALELLEEDILAYLFRLLQNTILRAESTAIIQPSATDSKSLLEMKAGCLVVESGLAGARLAVLMANHLGTGNLKSLYNESLVTSSLSLVRHQIEHSILPAQEALSSSALAKRIEQLAPRLSKLALTISGYAQEFVAFLKATELPFSIVISLVFTCIAALFAEIGRGSKASIFSDGASVNFKKQFQAVLQAIFVLYPEQRPLIVEEVIASLIKLPADKRSHKNFRLADGKSIHTATAIVLQLSQSCAERAITQPLAATPEYSRLEAEHFASTSLSFPPVGDAFVSGCQAGLEASNRVIGPVLQFLLARVAMGKASNGAEYRLILDAMVEDALLVLNSPEWPGAELFLRGICGCLLKVVDAGSDPSLTPLALEYFGSIAPRIRKPTTEALFLRYKGYVAEAESSEWIGALLQMPAELGADTSTRLLEPLWAFFEQLGRYLRALATDDPSYECARQLHLCDWGQYLGQAWVRMRADSGARGDDTQTSLEACLAKMIRQACERELPDSLFVSEQLTPSNRGALPILSRILVLMESPIQKYRSKAVKALAAILEASPEAAASPRIQQSIVPRLLDTSPAVRFNAVDLIGRCLASRPEMLQQYYAIVRERASDTSTSVRKCCIKILYEISKRADPPTLAEICCKLLSRTQDVEATVKALALKCLQTIWFSPPEGYELPAEGGAALNDTQAVRLEALPPAVREQLLGRAKMIVDMIASLSNPTADYVVSRFIATSLEKPEPESAIQHWSNCAVVARLLVDCLFHHLVRLDASSDKVPVAICNVMNALVAFGTTGGLLVPLKHLSALLPYLKGSLQATQCEDQMNMNHALKIYNLALPRIEHQPTPLLTEVESILVSRISNIAAAVLPAAIKCLCRVAFLLHTRKTRLFKAYATCLIKLKEAREDLQGGKPLEKVNFTARLLLIVGLIGRYIDTNPSKGDPGELINTEEHIDDMFELLFYFTDRSRMPKALVAAALQGLGDLAISYPKLFLRKAYRDWLVSILASDDIELKRRLLEALENYLNQEPSDLAPEGSSLKPKGDLAGLACDSEDLREASICSSIVQTLLPAINQSILSDPTFVQLKGLQVVGLVLDQGHINPVLCVPMLVTLQTEADKVLEKAACEIYTRAERKFPSLFHSRNLEAIQTAFAYHRRKDPNVIPRGYRAVPGEAHPKALLHFLYKHIQPQPSRREEFFTSVLKFFDFEGSKPITVEFLKFLVENLATFDYASPQELHSLFKKISPVLVMGELVIQYLGNKASRPRGITEAVAVHMADAISLLLVLKASLQQQFGLTSNKAYKEKGLTRLDVDAAHPWETFALADNSAARVRRLAIPSVTCKLRSLLERDLAAFQPDESLFGDKRVGRRVVRPTKRPKVPPKAPAKVASMSEDDSEFWESSSASAYASSELE
ncbi:Sister chromatid cohesion protein 2 [Massospora cicadina]|nr:Sister chromatid cohesion protein 2 [Massospora cicadina]